MATNVSNTWWDNYRQTIKVTKRFQELVSFVDSEDNARTMISTEKKQHPGKSEIWYLNKLIDEQKKNWVNSTPYLKHSACVDLVNMTYQFCD